MTIVRFENQYKSIRLKRSCFVVISLFLGACGPAASVPSEQQLLEWVSRGEVAAEAKQRRELLAMISPAYADGRGYGRDEINNLLRVYFLRQHTVSLLISIDDIRIFGETAAEIDLTIGMAGTNDGLLGFSADAYRFNLELEHDDDDWRLISAQWGELGEDLG